MTNIESELLSKFREALEAENFTEARKLIDQALTDDCHSFVAKTMIEEYQKWGLPESV